MIPHYEEGDKCPECGKGTLEYPMADNCSCHINPPCLQCLDVVLTCGECGWEDE